MCLHALSTESRDTLNKSSTFHFAHFQPDSGVGDEGKSWLAHASMS